MDLGAALNNFKNKIASGASDISEKSKELKSAGNRLKDEYDSSLGDKLSGGEKEIGSKEKIEEKENELDELMEILGLLTSEEEKEEIGFYENYPKNNLSESDKNKLIKMLKKYPNLKNEKEMPEDILKLLDDATLSRFEYENLRTGELIIHRRLEEAIKNNPNTPPAEMEKEIREAYALENPAHADAKTELDAEKEKFNAAKKDFSDRLISENPVPVLDNFDSVDYFNKVMDEWQMNYEWDMSNFEKQYLEDNPKSVGVSGKFVWDFNP